jgi:hypothetical protein
MAEIIRSSTPQSTAELNTDAVSAGYSHAIGPSGFEVKAHWFENVGLLQGRDLTAQIPWRGEHWHIAVTGQYRRSSFDPFETNTIVRDHKGTLITVSGVTSCDLDNTGYGAELGLDASPWSAYVRDNQYDYGSLRCSFSSSGLGLLARPDLAEFRQLAPNATNRLSRNAVIPLASLPANSLLASELSAGLRYAWGTLKLGLNYLHGRDELQGLVSNTYTAIVDYPVASHATLELQAGTIHAEAIGTVEFVGVVFKTLL